jgi:hypothetical protein
MYYDRLTLDSDAFLWKRFAWQAKGEANSGTFGGGGAPYDTSRSK